MKTEKDNTPLVDEYLQSLQGMEQAKTRPFFYARLKNRLEEKKQGQSGFILRPAYIICTLIVLLVINFWMINSQNYVRQNDNAVSSLSGFAETYNFTVYSY